MTAYQSDAAGNWSLDTNWDPEGVPGDGDTITNITHAITMDIDRTIGDSPGTDTSVLNLQINAGGRLTLAAGKTLILQGKLTGSDSSGTDVEALTLEAGAELHFNVPYGQNYTVNLGYTNTKYCWIQCDGTEGSPCKIKTLPGGGVGQLLGVYSGNGNIQATWTEFEDLGSLTDIGLRATVLNKTTSLSHCTFTRCGQVFIRAGSETAADVQEGTVLVEYCTWVDSLNIEDGGGSTYGSLWLDGPVALTTGSYIIDNCVFDILLRLDPDNVRVRHCVLYESFAATTGQWLQFEDNFDRQVLTIAQPTAIQSATAWGTVLDGYLLFDTTSTNPHGYVSATVCDTVVDGVIFEHAGSDAAGDLVVARSGTASYKLTVQNCISVPNDNGTGTGTLMSSGGNVNHDDITVEHNTACTSAGCSLCGVGENYDGHADLVVSFQSNIAWNATSGSYKGRDQSGTITDVVSSANADYNCGHNQLTGSNGKGYDNFVFSAGNPGDNDVDEDPAFVDASRKLATWDASLGGPGTRANALTELLKLNGSGWDSRYTVAALVAYVKAGFVPTNANLDSAAHDAGTIGAMPYAAPSSPPNILSIGPSALIS